jgi:hypothetical protein
MDIVQLAKAGLAVHKLSKDDVLNILSRVELTAAIESVRKSYFAQDARAAVQSAITHLEVAEAASLERTRVRQPSTIAGVPILSLDAVTRYHEVRYHFFLLLYIYASMCIFYYSLGEKKLVVYTFDKMKKAEAELLDFHNKADLTTPGNYLNPANWRFIKKPLPLSPEDYEQVVESMASWDISDADVDAVSGPRKSAEGG